MPAPTGTDAARSRSSAGREPAIATGATRGAWPRGSGSPRARGGCPLLPSRARSSGRDPRARSSDPRRPPSAGPSSRRRCPHRARTARRPDRRASEFAYGSAATPRPRRIGRARAPDRIRGAIAPRSRGEAVRTSCRAAGVARRSRCTGPRARSRPAPRRGRPPPTSPRQPTAARRGERDGCRRLEPATRRGAESGPSALAALRAPLLLRRHGVLNPPGLRRKLLDWKRKGYSGHRPPRFFGF